MTAANQVVSGPRPPRDKVGELLALVGKNVCYQCTWYDPPDSGRRGIGKCLHDPKVEPKRPADRCSKFSESEDGKVRVAAKAEALLKTASKAATAIETKAAAEKSQPTRRGPGRPRTTAEPPPIPTPPGWK